MSAASITTSTSARLGMMLTDLRLPTIKRLAGELCAQCDTEGCGCVLDQRADDSQALQQGRLNRSLRPAP